MPTPDNISVVFPECVTDRWGQGVSAEGKREEGVTHRGLCPLDSALKQVQCEIKEEIEGGGGTVSQCEENSLL